MPNHETMNTLKYLTPLYTFLLICIIPISKLSAQDWNYQIGLNSANFRFQSPAGIAQNSFQPDAGLQLSILRNDRLVDSAKIKSAFIRKLHYQVGLAINQFNSFVEAQNVPFTYSSTYVGLKLGLGMKSRLGKGLSLSYHGIMQINQLVLGSQKMGNQVYNLQGNKQFDRIQWLLGGEIKLAKRMNNHTAIFIYFSEAWQLNTIQKDGSQFAINPVSFGFGIQYSPLQ
jgi:CRISPR/Cas system-associated protein endoribonuclease Cas2